MNFYELLTPFALLFTGTFLGFTFGKISRVSSHNFSKAHIFIFSPLLMFTGTFAKQFEFDFVKIFFLAALLSTVLMILALLWSMIFPLSREENAIFLINSTVSNVGNFGMPLCVSILGEASIAPLSFVLLVHTIFANTAGAFFISGGQQDFKKSLKNIFKLPAIWAVLLGLCFQFLAIRIPVPIFESLKMFGNVAIPFSVFIFGMSLSVLDKFILPKRLFLQSVFLQLFLSPALAYVILGFFPVGELVAKVFLIESTVPLALITVALADVFNCKKEKAATIVLWSTLLSFVTIPLWLYFLFLT